jgi:hypothetical protein
MAEQNEKLAITSRVIDTGSAVIQVAHVTSASYGASHPLRPLGLALMAAAIGLIGYEVARAGGGAFVLSKAGSPLLWLAFAAGGIGLFLSIYAQRFLIVRTTDGARTWLSARDEEAASATLARIRDAIENGVRPPADPPRLALEAPPGGAPISLPHEPARQPQASPPRGLQAALAQRAAAAAGEMHVSPGLVTQPTDRSQRRERLNGHQQREDVTLGADGHAADPTQSLSRRHTPGLPRTLPEGTSAGAGFGGAHPNGVGGGDVRPPLRDPLRELPVLTTPPPRNDAAHDLQALMDHIRHADVQHKEALLDLLRVVEDHYRGAVGREEALAHWRSYADYAAQYLANVDGLPSMTERFGRHLQSR